MGPELPNNCCRPDWRYAALLTIDDQQTERGKRVMFPRTDVAELVDDLKPSPGVWLAATKALANYPTAARHSTSEACGSSKNIGVTGVEPVSADDVSEKLATGLSGV